MSADRGRFLMSRYSSVFSMPASHLSDIRSASVAAWISFLIFASCMMSLPARAQAPVPCDQLVTSVSSEFANSICFRDGFAGSDARGWHEQIQAENAQHLLTVVVAKTTGSRSYLRGTSLDQLFRRFALPPEMTQMGDKGTTEQGFEFVTIGAPASTHCLLFLREDRPMRGGYQGLKYGFACDKAHNSVYSIGDAEILLSKIDFAD